MMTLRQERRLARCDAASAVQLKVKPEDDSIHATFLQDVKLQDVVSAIRQGIVLKFELESLMCPCQLFVRNISQAASFISLVPPAIQDNVKLRVRKIMLASQKAMKGKKTPQEENF